MEDGTLGGMCSMHGKEKRALVINSEGRRPFGTVSGSLMLRLVANRVQNMI
jgi:hypothetical protein